MQGPALLTSFALLLIAVSIEAQPTERPEQIQAQLAEQLSRLQAAQYRVHELSAALAELERKPSSSTLAATIPVFVRATPSLRSEPIGKIAPGVGIVVLRALDSPWFEVLARGTNLYGFAMLHASDLAEPEHTERLLLFEAEYQLERQEEQFEQRRHGELEELQRLYSDSEESLRQAKRRRHLVEHYGVESGTRIANREVWRGMTVQQAYHAWGAPTDIDVGSTTAGRSEHWEYEDGRGLHFVNEQLLDVIEP